MRQSSAEPSSSEQLRQHEENERTFRRFARDHERIALYYDRLQLPNWANEQRRLAARARGRADAELEAREQLELDLIEEG